VPLTRQEIEDIADTVWRRPTANSEGVIVGAEQILSATEGRVRDLQHADPVTDSTLAPVVDMDALADRIVARLVARAAAAQPGGAV
jgi:F420-0:gamma-glutamyl ligase